MLKVQCVPVGLSKSGGEHLNALCRDNNLSPSVWFPGDPRRWLALTLGKQKRKKQLPLRRDTWTVTFSFLVYDLKEDVVSICKSICFTYMCRYISTVFVEAFSLSLSLSLSLPLPLPLPQLVTKVKLYRIVNTQVLATHSIALDSLGLLDEKGRPIAGVR